MGIFWNRLLNTAFFLQCFATTALTTEGFGQSVDASRFVVPSQNEQQIFQDGTPLQDKPEQPVAPPDPALTPVIPKECKYFQGVDCYITKAKILSIDSWDVSVRPKQTNNPEMVRACTILSTVERLPTSLNCLTHSGYPCMSNVEIANLGKAACETDSQCSLVHQVETVVTKSLDSDEAQLKKECQELFDARKAEIGETTDDLYSFALAANSISAAKLQCTAKCVGDTKEMTCPNSSQPTVSDAPICRMRIGPQKAKRGWKQFAEFYFPNNPDSSFAVCWYHKDCADFTLQNNMSVITDQKLESCQAFGVNGLIDSILPYQNYQSFCEKMELTLKADSRFYRSSTQIGYFPFAKRGQSNNFRWLWSWRTYRDWAKKSCDAWNEDRLDDLSVGWCADHLRNLQFDLEATKEVPTVTRACCQFPLK